MGCPLLVCVLFSVLFAFSEGLEPSEATKVQTSVGSTTAINTTTVSTDNSTTTMAATTSTTRPTDTPTTTITANDATGTTSTNKSLNATTAAEATTVLSNTTIGLTFATTYEPTAPATAATAATTATNASTTTSVAKATVTTTPFPNMTSTTTSTSTITSAKKKKCPAKQWRLFRGHCYILMVRPGFVREVFYMKKDCEKYGGQLVSIHSAEENALVHAVIRHLGKGTAYVGLNRAPTDFKWMDHTEMNYTNWKAGENLKTCVMMEASTGKWITNECHPWGESICKVLATDA